MWYSHPSAVKGMLSASLMAPASSETTTCPVGGVEKPENTYGPAPLPLTVVAGDVPTKSRPAVTPVTGSLNTTDTVGSLLNAASRAGVTVLIRGGFSAGSSGMAAAKTGALDIS